MRELLLNAFMNLVVQVGDALQAWHNLLLELFGFRVSSESLSPAFSGGKMDEVCLITIPRCQRIYIYIKFLIQL